MNILQINSSTKPEGSATRTLVDQVIARISQSDTTITTRDLIDGIPLLDGPTTADLATPAADRSPESTTALAVSDQLVAELTAADAIVIGAPIYNFGVPGPLKAWADLVARAGTTFRYTSTGPEGLLANRPTYIVTAAGGVPVGSSMDFATPWLTTFLGFLGITDVTIIAAEGLASDPDGGMSAAAEQVRALPVAA